MRVLVTGGGRGVGLGIVERALRAGHEVEAVHRTPMPELDELDRRFSGLSTLRLDLTDPEAEDRLRAWHADRPLDVLVNNAGLYAPDGASYHVGGQRLDTVERHQALELYLTNAVAPMVVVRACRHRFALDRPEPRGTIANISSLVGTPSAARQGGHYLYGPTKAALNWITIAMAHDLAPLVVVAVTPGWVRTRSGGADAPRDVRTAAKDVWRVVAGVGPAESGWFLDENGERLG